MLEVLSILKESKIHCLTVTLNVNFIRCASLLVALEEDLSDTIQAQLNPIHLVLRNLLQVDNYTVVLALAKNHFEQDPVCKYFYYAAQSKVLSRA